MRNWEIPGNDTFFTQTRFGLRAKMLFSWLLPVLLIGCITPKLQAPVRMVDEQSALSQDAAGPQDVAGPQDEAGHPIGGQAVDGQAVKPSDVAAKPEPVWVKPIRDTAQRLEQLDKNSRETLAILQQRMAAQEEELRLLRGNLEVMQHENKGVREWLTLIGKPAASDVAMPQAEMAPVEQSYPVENMPPVQPVTGTGLLPVQPNGEVVLPPASSEETPQRVYDAAFLLLKNGQYEASREAFNRFLEKFPSDALSDNAQYWIGELYSVQKHYREALVAFNQVLVRWPSSSKVPACLLKMGFAFYELGDMGNAHTSLTRLVTDYPSSPAVVMARQRLRDIDNKRKISDKMGLGSVTKKGAAPSDQESRRVQRINRVMGE